MRTPTEMIKNGQTVHFTHACQGFLWYVTECGFAFPVPLSDIGEATFEPSDKALLFLRYIRAQHASPVALTGASDFTGSAPSVRFTRYRQGFLWYVTDDGFAFPVPMADSADVVFPAAAHQAPQFLPHITTHRAFIETARLAQENVS
jgi:hypothetical protein